MMCMPINVVCNKNVCVGMFVAQFDIIQYEIDIHIQTRICWLETKQKPFAIQQVSIGWESRHNVHRLTVTVRRCDECVQLRSREDGIIGYYNSYRNLRELIQ